MLQRSKDSTSAIRFILLFSGLRFRVVYMVTRLYGGITMLQKDKVVPLQAMKAYKGYPTILNLCTRRSGKHHAPAALHPEKKEGNY